MGNPYEYTPTYVATGNVNVCRFVSADPAVDKGARQSVATDVKILGVSGPGQLDPPGGPTIYGQGLIAVDGLSLEVFGPGSSEILLEIGVGGCVSHDWLKPDATGKGIVAATGATAGARALSAVDANGMCRVHVIQPFVVP